MKNKKKTAGPKKRAKRSPKRLKDGSLAEAEIQKSILDWLATQPFMSWRSNAGALFLRGRHVNLGPIGCADISIVYAPTGRFIGLEVKSSGGRQRNEQRAYQIELEASGGLYFIVRSLEQAKRVLRSVSTSGGLCTA
jgi:hypothetical protein